MIITWIDEAVEAGAREDKACEILGLSGRCVARWRRNKTGDSRKGPLTPPPQKLSPEERQQVLDTANSPEFRDLSPRQIVPLMADRNQYIASESTFYRILTAEGQLHHR